MKFTGIPSGAEKQQIKAQIDGYYFKNMITLCAWVKYDKNPDAGVSPFAIFSHVVEDDKYAPIFWINSKGVAASGNQLIDHELEANQWYHVAVICDLETASISLRVNGARIKSTSFAFPYSDSSFRVIIGEQTDGTQSFVGGIVVTNLKGRQNLFRD